MDPSGGRYLLDSLYANHDVVPQSHDNGNQYDIGAWHYARRERGASDCPAVRFGFLS